MLNFKKETELGFKKARSITKKFARTFYYASHFLSTEKKYAAYAVYAICRLSDEKVDSAAKDPQKLLERLSQKINLAYSQDKLDDALLLAFRKTVNRYLIPKQYFKELIQGMYMDLEKNRYKTFDELYQYCYRVAGLVGLIMLKIFDCADRVAEKFAIELGIAIQLTNILRDAQEDFRRGRVYFPQEEMQRFAVKEDDIAAGQIKENFKNFFKFQIGRARQYYAHACLGINLIKDFDSRLVICLMKDMYAAILDGIESNNYDVFSKQLHLNLIAKTVILLKVLFKAEFL